MPSTAPISSVELTVRASSGGLEAQDWARILLRMYTRWLKRHDYPYHVEETEDGEQGTLRNATISIASEKPRIAKEAYSLLRSEEGVHRLTRVSPFDANKRRQTSFATVEITPVRTRGEFSLDLNEVRVDTFRSSGKGGQNVNKRDTAVRATHLPTGLTAQRQSRSQHQNRVEALAALAARVERAQQQPAKENRNGERAWGHQIRSYAFVPHALVKDHRSGKKIGNLQGVLNGDLDKLLSR
jgi:peptide chain release factor 2